MAAARTLQAPRVTFSTLARLMGPTTPVGQANLLRGHKHPTLGPKLSYLHAQRQFVENVVHQRPINPLAGNLKKHEAEALALFAGGYAPPAGSTAAKVNPNANQVWSLNGVDLSVFPDVTLSGPAGSGAVKAYFGKDRLARGVGASMAALLHHHRLNVLSIANTHAAYCVVVEVRTGSVYTSSNPASLMRNITVACQLVAALWPIL